MKAHELRVLGVSRPYRGALEALASGDKDGTAERHASPQPQACTSTRDLTDSYLFGTADDGTLMSYERSKQTRRAGGRCHLVA